MEEALLISKGFQDKTIIEFKLASNSKLRQNLQNQVEIYKISNDTNKDILVLFFFTEDEKNRLYKIINELQLSNLENVIVIDCRKQKPSASNVMSTVGTGQYHAQHTRITKEVRSDTEQ